MSGIAGIVNLNGAPVDRDLLGRMTGFLSFRGPDARRVWTNGAAGFGHTLLRTTDEAENEQQPLTLDGRVWIVADARVDARSELVSKLQAAGRDASLERPDVELILHAYHVWGEQCVEHLLGDFAFAIWDAPLRRLFCARDHMGVKPFYFFHTGSTVVFSNTLDCLRLHPAVSARLNDLAIADFLLFDDNLEIEASCFADIRKLPPAHTATWTSAGLTMRRYWSFPIDEPVHYRRLDDYTDRFRELLRQSVSDRLRTPRVGVFMSGGIDSPSLAAAARDLTKVTAYTRVFDGIDQERHYAGLVAKRLRIPIDFRDGNAEGMDPDWEQRTFHTPEPAFNPLILAQDLVYHRKVADRNRVVFYGEGPDAALHFEWRPYLEYLTSRRQLGRLAADVGRHMIAHRRIPLLSTLPRKIRRRGMEKLWSNGYPRWINKSFEARLGLRQRWQDMQFAPGANHPVRPGGHASVTGPQWPVMFEELDAGNMMAPLEFRHPYFDIRLLRYMLAVPALPWCRVKYLLRRSMRGVLPEPVLRRPKAPLDPYPWAEFTRRSGFAPFRAAEGISEYVDTQTVPSVPPQTLGDFREALRPRRINCWLKDLNHTNIGYHQEEYLYG